MLDSSLSLSICLFLGFKTELKISIKNCEEPKIKKLFIMILLQRKYSTLCWIIEAVLDSPTIFRIDSQSWERAHFFIVINHIIIIYILPTLNSSS